MTAKEEKKTFDINKADLKLLKSLFDTKTEGYEAFNIVTDDGDSIYAAADLEELANNGVGGQVFISKDKIEDFVNQLINQRLGFKL